MEKNNRLLCWNCKQPIEKTGINCPHCHVFLDKEMIDRIADGKTNGIPSGGLQAGTVLDDRYEIIKPLGRGGMGIVYKAHDRYMDRDVALKLIPKELAMDPKAIADLKRETSLALDLTHEHIVRLYNLDTWQNYTFVTMEYVQCGTLSHLMVEKGGRLSLGEVLPLLKQVAQSLDYAHSKNPPVVHLDLKPLNILLTVDGYAKVTDFGLARVLRDLATRVSAWEAAGSLAYMAPEQIRGKGIGTWTDVYALAAVAYELLSGQPPFYTGDLRWQIMHEDVDPIQDLPEHVNRALLLGLAKDSSMRPRTAGDFVKMLAGEIPVPDVNMLKELSEEKVRQEIKTGGPNDSMEWKEEWFESYVEKEESSEGYRKRSFFVYSIIAVLCLLVLGQLVWILYSQNYIPKELINRAASVFQTEEKPGSVPEVPIPGKKADQRIARTPVEKPAVSPTIPPPQEKEKAAPVIGGVSIITRPDQAGIIIDDREMGLSPLAIRDLKEGKHLVRIQKEGFQSWKGEILVQPDKAVSLDVDLVPITGSVTLNSDPNGAQIFVNGKPVGVTPVELERQLAGEVRFEIRKDGYQKWEKKMALPVDQKVSVQAKLVSLPGKVSITSIPRKADVYVGGKRVGRTPLELERTREKKVKIEVRKSCYESVTRTVTFTPGKKVNSKFVLKSACGSFRVKSIPSGADWFLNGKAMGKTPGKTSSLEKGTYSIRVTKKQFADWEVKATIRPKKRETIIATLDALTELDKNHYLDKNLYIEPITGMEFVWVKNGCFEMGSPEMEKGRSSDESPVHKVCLDGFWMGRYEVTQDQWRKLFSKNPSHFQLGGDYPVENVSWNDAHRFVEKLNGKSKGRAVYRLPTEAEWEYACRSGGRDELYSGGSDIDLTAWYKSNSGMSPHPVGRKKSNGLGVFDMSGNVFEWVEDVYFADAYLRHDQNNPIYKGEGDYRVCRGGSWFRESKESRSANRSFYSTTSRNYNLGFRIVKIGK